MKCYLREPPIVLRRERSPRLTRVAKTSQRVGTTMDFVRFAGFFLCTGIVLGFVLVAYTVVR